MSLQKKLDRIDSEIDRGLKFKAADSLRNLIQENPNEIELWDKLAKLYYDSGFLDAAGKYWILTEPVSDRIEKCVTIYEKSVNYSGYQILQEIVFRGDKSKLSKYAQKKLSELESDSKKKNNYVPTFSPKTNKKGVNSNNKQTFKGKVMAFVVGLILLLIGIFVVIGFVTVVRWIF